MSYRFRTHGMGFAKKEIFVFLKRKAEFAKKGFVPARD
jgi:hypothetical protein